MTKFSFGRIAAGVGLALGCAALLALGLVFPGLMQPAVLIALGFVMLSPLIIALLYAWSGPVPAFLAGAVTLSFSYLMGENPVQMMLVCALGLVLPGLGYVLLLRARCPFFQGMQMTIALQLGALLLALGAARVMLNEDLVGAFLGYARHAVSQLPVGLVNQYLLLFGRLGMVSAPGVDFSMPFLMPLVQTQLIESLFANLETGVRVMMPAMLLSYGVMLGMTGYALPAWVCARRGEEPPVPIVHLSDWRLPKTMIIALPACTLLLWILLQAGMLGADAAYQALLGLTGLAFAVQGAAALSRRMRLSGAARGRRLLMIAFGWIFARWLFTTIGVWSALMGSKGLITEYLRKRNDNTPKGDDWF